MRLRCNLWVATTTYNDHFYPPGRIDADTSRRRRIVGGREAHTDGIFHSMVNLARVEGGVAAQSFAGYANSWLKKLLKHKSDQISFRIDFRSIFI